MNVSVPPTSVAAGLALINIDLVWQAWMELTLIR